MKVNVTSFTQPALVCEANSFMSQKQINYLDNPPRAQNKLYSTTYSPGWKNNPNFSWNQGPPHNQNNNQADKISILESTLEKFLQETIETLKNHRAILKNLKTQIGHLSK